MREDRRDKRATWKHHTHKKNVPGNNTSQTALRYMLCATPLPAFPYYPSCQVFPLGQSPGKSHKLTTNSQLVVSPKLSRPLLQGFIYQIIPNLQKATKSAVLSRTLPQHKALCSQLPPLSCSICCLGGALNCTTDMLNPSGSTFSAVNP